MTAPTSSAVPPAPEAGRRTSPAPARADGVQLLGEFAGSGYREAPALLRRADGQVIKLTPLLYELVDAIDGRRGCDELAAELGRRVKRRATPDDVRFLIDHKLRPLGVLRQTDGSDPELMKSNPLLVLRPRFVISRERTTQWMTAPFVWLFNPVVVIPAVVAFIALTAWLFSEQGLASALHQAFYEPGMLLVIWALVVVSAAFHEIGHAAACRYGGAKPGVIGGGLYMIWPAFYTEVTDAYRLSRGARLRVDLGGLYFSLLFALGTAAVWKLTAADALLLVIAVQLVQMVRQLVPFIRADGYHIVADVIGVPDLFAHIKPTLMSALPTRWGRGDHALKPWARAVVTAWVAVTVPALVFVLGYIVLLFPRMAASAWDSMGLRWEEAGAFWHTGDPAGVAMSLIFIVLLALPVLGVVYLVSYFGRRMAASAWRGTEGRPAMRGLAVLAGAALLGLLAWAWWPGEKYRPINANEPGPAPAIVLSPGTWVQTLDALPVVVVPSGGEPVYGAPPGQAPAGYELVAPAPLAPAPAPADDAGPIGPMPAATIERPESLGTSAPDPSDPMPAAEAEPPSWPFPFDPPDPPEPGDNFAMAVNTADDSVVWDFAYSMLLLEGGDQLLNANQAHAYASCTNCVTGAVAFQVLLILGQVDEIAPLNAAVAANYLCSACGTYAFAYQIVASILEAPTAEIQAQLDLAFEQLAALEQNAGSMSAAEILLALEQIEHDVLEAISGILTVGHTASVTAASSADGASPATPGEVAPDSGGDDQDAPGAPAGAAADDDAPEAASEPDTANAQPPGETATDSTGVGSEPAPETTGDEPAEDSPEPPSEESHDEGTSDGSEVSDENAGESPETASGDEATSDPATVPAG